MDSQSELDDLEFDLWMVFNSELEWLSSPTSKDLHVQRKMVSSRTLNGSQV